MEGHSSQFNFNSNEVPNEEPLNLLSLNEHCLLKIFNYLYIADTIMLSNTCRQMLKLSRMAVKKFKKFKLSEYKSYVDHKTGRGGRHRGGRPVPLRTILYLISPNVESINFHTEYVCSNLMDERELKLIKMMKFPKIKTLTVRNSEFLKWLNVNNLEELKIFQVNPNDLNNFAHGLTKLKKLTIVDISKDVPLVELYYFLEKNQNLECLKFDKILPFGFKTDIFARLRNLQKLQLTLGKCVPILMNLQKIEQLRVLSLRFYQSFAFTNRMANYARIKTLLKKLSEKKTLETLKLAGMFFEDADVLEDFASSNLSSLHLIQPIGLTQGDNFYYKLANAPFLRLRHLYINPIRICDTMVFIEHLKTLERITLHTGSPGVHITAFLEQANLVLGQSTRANNAFELEMISTNTFKARFQLGRYEVKTVTAAKEYTGLFENSRPFIIQDYLRSIGSTSNQIVFHV